VNIPLCRPDITEREIEYVTRALRSGQLSLGPRLAEFEERFAAYIGTRYAVATNSGTSALHLCVKAHGIEAGDEVLTTSFSFVASANCLLYERAVPTFVDIHPAMLNIDPRELEQWIERHCSWERVQKRLIDRSTGRTVKAILPVHIFGLPCDMTPILGIARRFNLRVIEDACEAIGAKFHGRRVGTFGDVAAFAFYPNKQMTTAEGGMVVTNDKRVAGICRSLRNQGRDPDSEWLSHTRLGYNYRLSDLHCALGLAQLERIDELLAARARVAAAYTRELMSVPQVVLPHSSPELNRSWFVYPIQLAGPASAKERDRLMQQLRRHGIACQAYFPAIHKQPYYRETAAAARVSLPHTESVSSRCLALPFYGSMTDEEIREVCSAVRESLTESHPILDQSMHRAALVARAGN
jgi:perosamine synthetase